MLKRGWKHVNPTSGSNPFIAMQWNALADNLCTTSSFPFANKEILQWNERKDALLSFIVEVSPDILGLEEVDRYKDHFLPFFEENGYDSHFFIKQNGNDGSVVAWKKSRFTAERKPETFYYTKEASQGAIIQSLTCNDSGNTIHVAVTHLVSNFDKSILFLYCIYIEF